MTAPDPACLSVVDGPLWAIKVVESDSGCLIWTGAHGRNGYGSVRVDRRTMLAHRVAWMAVNGPVPSGSVLDHLCRVRDCVNVAHLEVVTPGENTRRGYALITHCPKGHLLDGENLIAGMAKAGRRACLTCNREKDSERHELIRQARSVLGLSHYEYRDQFGSSAQVARAVIESSSLIREQIAAQIEALPIDHRSPGRANVSGLVTFARREAYLRAAAIARTGGAR